MSSDERRFVARSSFSDGLQLPGPKPGREHGKPFRLALDLLTCHPCRGLGPKVLALIAAQQLPPAALGHGSVSACTRGRADGPARDVRHASNVKVCTSRLGSPARRANRRVRALKSAPRMVSKAYPLRSSCGESHDGALALPQGPKLILAQRASGLSSAPPLQKERGLGERRVRPGNAGPNWWQSCAEASPPLPPLLLERGESRDERAQDTFLSATTLIAAVLRRGARSHGD